MEQDLSKGERVAKIIARSGITSRRDAERMIAAGRVTVNGQLLKSPALNVTVEDRIKLDGQEIKAPERERLWLFHKPLGLISTSRDEQDRQTIFDVLPNDLPRVINVGRLDMNSEGLLLLTNDGAIKRQLELPTNGWLRRYRVRVRGAPDDKVLAPLRNGVRIEGKEFRPMEITLDRQQGANAWLTIGLREGKNREIRRAMEHIGMMVNRLIRISYGPFQLGNLKPGEVEEVRRKVLRVQLGFDNSARQSAKSSGSTKRPHIKRQKRNR